MGVWFDVCMLHGDMEAQMTNSKVVVLFTRDD